MVWEMSKLEIHFNEVDTTISACGVNLPGWV